MGSITKRRTRRKAKGTAKTKGIFVDRHNHYCLTQTSNEQWQGVLLYYDELSSLIAQQNRYKNKGNDEEVMLSGRDGTGIRVKRKGGTRYDKATASWTVLGGITTSILSKQMGTGLDEAGHWARFIMATLPNVEQEFPEDFPAVDISAMIKSLYQSIEKTTTDFYKEGGTNGLIRLSKRAKEKYRKYWKETESAKVAEARPALRSVLAKSKRLVGEIALLLYVVETAFSGEELTPKLPENFMELAIALTKVYVAQIRLIHHNQNKDDDLSPKLSKILDLAHKKGTITARDVKRSNQDFRKLNASDIRVMFEQLANLGYGVVSGTAIHLTFSPSKNFVAKMSPNVAPEKTSSNLDIVVDTEVYPEKFCRQIFPTGSNPDTVIDTSDFSHNFVAKMSPPSNDHITTTEANSDQFCRQYFSHTPDSNNNDSSPVLDKDKKEIHKEKVATKLGEKQGQSQSQKEIQLGDKMATKSDKNLAQSQTQSQKLEWEKSGDKIGDKTGDKMAETQTESNAQGGDKAGDKIDSFGDKITEEFQTRIIQKKNQFLSMVSSVKTVSADLKEAMRSHMYLVKKDLSETELLALCEKIHEALSENDAETFVKAILEL